jgi:formate dehydrogenase major subunit
VRVDGQLVETSWDVALERAADGFRRNPPGSTGMFSCSKATNEMNYVAQKFARTVLHTNNVDSCNRT